MSMEKLGAPSLGCPYAYIRKTNNATHSQQQSTSTEPSSSRRTVLLRPKNQLQAYGVRRTVFWPEKNQLQAYGVLAGQKSAAGVRCFGRRKISCRRTRIRCFGRTDRQNLQKSFPPRRRRVLLLCAGLRFFFFLFLHP